MSFDSSVLVGCERVTLTPVKKKGLSLAAYLNAGGIVRITAWAICELIQQVCDSAVPRSTSFSPGLSSCVPMRYCIENPSVGRHRAAEGRVADAYLYCEDGARMYQGPMLGDVPNDAGFWINRKTAQPQGQAPRAF